jgi:hypothetical protein
MRGPGPLDPISTILSGLARRLGLETKLFESRLKREWPQIVGEQLAAHTRPQAIRFKKLFLLVPNSVWLHQLSFLKSMLLEKVNAIADKPMVSEIVLRVGEFVNESRAGDPLASKEQVTAPSAALLEEAERHARGVQDPALRAHLAAVIAQVLSRAEGPPSPPRRSFP